MTEQHRTCVKLTSAVIGLLLGGCGGPEHSSGAEPGACGAPCEGEIAVKVDVNRCPSLTFLTLAPSRTTVGSKAHFSALVTDPDGDEVVTFWTATSGRLTAEGASSGLDTFTCLEVGTHIITLWYSDSRGCAGQQGTAIDCDQGEDVGG